MAERCYRGGAEVRSVNRRLCHPQQEYELVLYTERGARGGFFPARATTGNLAMTIAKSQNAAHDVPISALHAHQICAVAPLLSAVSQLGDIPPPEVSTRKASFSSPERHHNSCRESSPSKKRTSLTTQDGVLPWIENIGHPFYLPCPRI